MSVFSLGYAQEEAVETTAAANTPSGIETLMNDYPFQMSTILFLGVMIVLILIIMIFFAQQLASYYVKNILKEGEKAPWAVKLFLIFSGDTQFFTGEYTDQEIEGHSYDGIKELDNDLPPWWLWMFYITVFFGVVYLLNYHVFKTGKLQTEEYIAEVEYADKIYANVDQEYEGPATEDAILAMGKEAYDKTCMQCHGNVGQGTIGPNLTDKYWLHGGGINDIYKTIKYGVTGKAMQAWKSTYSNEQIYAISSYIMSMQGTNPEGAKDPEGELVE